MQPSPADLVFAQPAPLSSGRAVALRFSGRAGHLPGFVAVLLVGAPNLVFLATHLANPFLAVVTVAGAGLSLALVAADIHRTEKALDPILLLACSVVALGLMVLGGQGHLAYANTDWLIRDAVLVDLVAQPWPVGYWYQGEATVLRAPLGMYLLPATAGKRLGLGWAHGCLLAQNTMLFAGILYGLASGFPPRRKGWAILATFLVFSGWDAFGALLTGRTLAFGSHLEPWNPLFQYSSHVAQLFWVPNHAAPGWLLVTAYLAWSRQQISAASLAVLFGVSAFWSPLSTLGALPFVLLALGSDLARGRLELRGLLQIAISGISLLPVGLFLVTDSGRVAHGFEPVSVEFILLYAVFLIFEIGPGLAILASCRASGPSSVQRRDMLLILAILVLAPLYKVGAADFVMRASIPALALLAVAVAERVASLDRHAHPAATAFSLAALAIGSVTPLYEIGRALTRPAFAISRCNALTANRFPPNNGPMYHYFARLSGPAPFGLGNQVRKPTSFLTSDPAAVCWPDRQP